MSDPTTPAAHDVLAPPATDHDARAFADDADADEGAALERTHRWGRVISIADRYATTLASGALEPLRHETAASLARLRAWQNRERGPALGVPCEDGVMDHAALDAPAPTPALAAVRAALAWRAARGPHRPLVLVLMGATGSGKSVALGWAVLHHARTARQVTAADVPRRIEHSEAKAERARLLTVDLLAIDELGGRSDEQPAQVLDLVLERFNAGRVTLLGGNLTPDHFLKHYSDARLASRLRRQQAEGQRVVVQLATGDMRTAGPR